MLVIRQHRIYRQDLQANPNLLYIFGDNLSRTGMGGQAKEMRGEPNAFGIATKRRPSHGSAEDYFHDAEPDLRALIDREFWTLRGKFSEGKYQGIVVPLDGIGTGLAKLSLYAPNLLHYINTKIYSLNKL